MSYDYNTLVQTINQCRRDAYLSTKTQLSLETLSSEENKDRETGQVKNLEKTVETFNTFSTLCPMTPLLWMQYAQDMFLLMMRNCDDQVDGSISMGILTCYETACGVLELGIEEFPSCALLQLMYLDLNCVFARLNLNKDSSPETLIKQFNDVHELFEQIMNALGIGTTHDEVIMVGLYNTYLTFLGNSIFLFSDESHHDCRDLLHKSAIEIFLKRSEMLWKSGNDSLMDEICLYEAKFQTKFSPEEHNAVEKNKRDATMSGDFRATLHSMGQDIQIAMANEAILPSQSPFSLDSFISIWSLQPKNSSAAIHGINRLDMNNITTFFDWEMILKPNYLGENFLMGCGLYETATSFIKYTQKIIHQIKIITKQLSKSPTPEKERLELSLDILYKMILTTFEHGISECCTVECLWEKYLNHLSYLLHNQNSNNMTTAADHKYLLKKMNDVAKRSVKNCPYSVKLFSYQMKIIEDEARFGQSIFDPDAIMKIVKSSIESGFLNQESWLSVYQAACSVMKNHILQVTSYQTSQYEYDSHEPLIGKQRLKGQDIAEIAGASLVRYKNPLDEETGQEIKDWIEDLRDIYDEIEISFRQKYSDWHAGRARLLLERAEVEGYILEPIMRSLDNSLDETIVTAKSQAIKYFEKLVRMQHIPSHPSWYRKYIRFVLADVSLFGDITQKFPGMITSKVRHARDLFQRAMASVKRQYKHTQVNESDSGTEAALRSLSEEYIEFETLYGSEKSLGIAYKLIKEKILLPNSDIKGESTKRKYAASSVESSSEDKSKKPRISLSSGSEKVVAEVVLSNSGTFSGAHGDNSLNQGADNSNHQKKTNLKEPKEKSHKVRVGKLDYPAHPYTIRVSNLSEDTQDMDLVDLFTKCGAIVHARIVREKCAKQHSKQKSRGFGLVQFEERDSIEIALLMNGEVGLHEKLIKVDRSHQPAVASKVPPGMHRHGPKGSGKKSQRRKERRNSEETIAARTIKNTKDKADDDKDQKNIKSNILMFQPRCL